MGFELATNEVKYLPLSSDRSLLDWDIILFRADDYIASSANHWPLEINDALEMGKMVIAYLCEQTPNYLNIEKVDFRKGNCIKLATTKHAQIIADYWAEFGELSTYKVILDKNCGSPILLTQSGDKIVGGIRKLQSGKGTMLLLPDIDFNLEGFSETNLGGNWKDKAHNFSSKLIKHIVSIHKALTSNCTPPEWVTNPNYVLPKEDKLLANLEQVEQQIKTLQIQKNKLQPTIKKAGRLRGLLYEKGKALELAILDALKILGFKAVSFEQGNLAFDVVFTSQEGRFIGEAEGKDHKAINIDKFRQLESNISQDLQRDEVKTSAKGVLFGNAFRLAPIQNRVDPFTEKCKDSSQRNSTALVFTPDLFVVVWYLSRYEDAAFAKQCRATIASTIGYVLFPEIPNKGKAAKAKKEL